MEYKVNADEDDLIIISDLDEIPNMEQIGKFNPNMRYAVFKQKHFYYKINLQSQKNPFWYGSKICVKKYLKSPQWLRNLKFKKRPFDGMCVISDKKGVLGLGGIIGGTRSGTNINTKNILLESAYFEPRSIRSTSKKLNLDTDAKFRFERGIDLLSIEDGLNKAALLIKEICGGKISKIDIQRIETDKIKTIKFDTNLFEKG